MASLPPVTEIARRLITLRTVNPPGNEAPAQGYLASVLQDAGVEVKTIETEAGRPNLVCRLQGRGDRPGLVLHGHVDVVGIDGQQWEHDPFAAAVVDGVLHGRGALDMKAGVAMLTHAFARAASEGIVPSGDVLLAIVADSESGGAAGLDHLLDRHARLFDGAGHAIGEFGGFPLDAFGRRFYRIGVSMKRYAHLRLHLAGRGGHGSRPASGTVVGALGRVLARLDTLRFPHHRTPVAEEVIEAMAASVSGDEAAVLRSLVDPGGFDAALARLAPHEATFEAMFRDTANPTIVRAGAKFNVIPSEAHIEIDARLLPGREVDDTVEIVRATVDPEEVEIEVVATGPPVPAHFDGALLPELGAILTELDPDGVPIPFLFSESPDGRLFASHGIQHYAFLPMNLPPGMDLPDLIHGPDERVPLSAIDFGAEALHRLLSRY